MIVMIHPTLLMIPPSVLVVRRSCGVGAVVTFPSESSACLLPKVIGSVSYFCCNLICIRHLVRLTRLFLVSLFLSELLCQALKEHCQRISHYPFSFPMRRTVHGPIMRGRCSQGTRHRRMSNNLGIQFRCGATANPTGHRGPSVLVVRRGPDPLWRGPRRGHER